MTASRLNFRIDERVHPMTIRGDSRGARFTESRRRFSAVILVAASALVTGCGWKTRPRPPSAPVRGAVLFNDAPLQNGEIYFLTPQTGVVDVLPIHDGRFEGTVAIGSRTVQIYSFIDGGVVPEGVPGAGQPIRTNVIPARYSDASELRAEVDASKDNVLDFKLSKP
jgi:hypothetical protein